MADVIVTLITLAAMWRIFQKMGREGWEGIIPLYDVYIICDILYGNGWKMLLLLIPFYNIYFMFKMNIDLAGRFGKSKGFGVGMTLLSVVFDSILAFSDAKFDDGSMEKEGTDGISRFLQNTAAKVSGQPAETADEKLRKLNDLYKDGVISEEEYNEKKQQLLKDM